MIVAKNSTHVGVQPMQAVAACEEKPPSGQWLRVSVDSFQATPVFKITTRIDSSQKTVN